VAGGLVAIDDMIEGVERAVIDTLGEGLARGGRAIGVCIVVGLLTMVGMLPLAAAILTGARQPTLLLAMAAGGAVGLVAVVRFALALPLAVLGQREVTDAVRESWSLTRQATAPVVWCLLLGGLVTIGLGLLASLLALVPVLGWRIGRTGPVSGSRPPDHHPVAPPGSAPGRWFRPERGPRDTAPPSTHWSLTAMAPPQPAWNSSSVTGGAWARAVGSGSAGRPR
jgi:hypothetical protein